MRVLEKVEVSDNSKKMYGFYLKKINNNKVPRSGTEFEDIEVIKNRLNNNNYSVNTKIFIVNAIMSVLKTFNHKKYGDLYEKYKTLRDKVLIPEKEKMMEAKKVSNVEYYSDEKNQPVIIKDIKNPLSRFIYSLYTLTTPRRAMDYYAMVIVKNKDEIPEMPVLNYLCEENKTFYFSKYKTSIRYKTQEIKIPDELWEEYQIYKPKRSEKNNSLLQKSNGDPVDNNQFIHYYLTKVIGKGKSVNFLRHKFVKDELYEAHKAIEEKAREMGHSFATNNYYFNN